MHHTERTFLIHLAMPAPVRRNFPFESEKNVPPSRLFLSVFLSFLLRPASSPSRTLRPWKVGNRRNTHLAGMLAIFMLRFSHSSSLLPRTGRVGECRRGEEGMFFLPFFFWEGLAAKKSFKGGKECCRTHLLLVVAFCNRNQDVVLAIFYDDAEDFYFIQLRIVYFLHIFLYIP